MKTDAPTKTERAARLSVADWANAALDLLAEKGLHAVAVEPLARHLGVTKGSFYWHFPSREALLRTALEHWEQVDLDEVFKQLEVIEPPRTRLLELFQRGAHRTRSHLVYSKLLKASEHPVVQPVMQRVSQRRLAFLSQAYRQLGMSPCEAGHRARLTYAAYAGFLQVSQHLARLSPDAFDAYVEHMANTLIPAA